MLTSGTTDYLWILSRTPQTQDSMYQHLIRQAANYGFDDSPLHEVSH
jgi:lipocalin